jgi:hypothetical protein
MKKSFLTPAADSAKSQWHPNALASSEISRRKTVAPSPDKQSHQNCGMDTCFNLTRDQCYKKLLTVASYEFS